MNALIEASFRQAILTEKRSFDFYRKMSATVQDSRTKKFFAFLAQEEADHMRSFVMRYPGDEFDLLAIVESPTVPGNPAYQRFISSAQEGLHEQLALEISLFEERDCLEHYTTMITCIKQPTVCTVFEQAIEDTRKHYAVIMAEYLRCNGKLRLEDRYPLPLSI